MQELSITKTNIELVFFQEISSEKTHFLSAKCIAV
jgi:hypothetical protein